MLKKRLRIREKSCIDKYFARAFVEQKVQRICLGFFKGSPRNTQKCIVVLNVFDDFIITCHFILCDVISTNYCLNTSCNNNIALCLMSLL